MRRNGQVDRCEEGPEKRLRIPRCVALSTWIIVALNAAIGLASGSGPEPDDEKSAFPSSVTAPSEPEARPPLPAPVPSTPAMSTSTPANIRAVSVPRPVLDPAAQLLDGNEASEAWTLYIELESGHRITQRFLVTNSGPGKHNAVAVGHLSEPGRAPYRFENGRRRSRWTLSDDGLFFDIAASHLDLHRPKGELRITKDDIEIRLFFDFAGHDPSARIPEAQLPAGYQIELLAVGAPTRGSIQAPWMAEAIETRGHTWLVHAWTDDEEAALLARRVEVFGRDDKTSFYGIQLRGRGDWESAWILALDHDRRVIESSINVPARWSEGGARPGSQNYPTPSGFEIAGEAISGSITLGPDWLRYDPLEVIPLPFRWLIRRKSKPREVWADAQIGVRLPSSPHTPFLPAASKTLSVQAEEASRSKRETEDETVERSVTGVASITYLNPVGRR